MSVRELENDLAELQAVLPTLGGRLSGLLGRIEKLEPLLRETEQDASSLKVTLGYRRAGPMSSLHLFVLRVEKLDKDLQATVPMLSQAWQTASTRLEAEETALMEAQGRWKRTLDLYDKALASATDDIRDACEPAEKVVEALETTAASGARRIRAASEAVSQQAERLARVVQQAKASLGDASQALLMRIVDMDEALRREIAAWQTRLGDQAKALQEHDDGVGTKIRASMDALRNDGIVPRLEQAVDETVRDFAGGAREVLETLSGTAVEGQAALAEAGDGLRDEMAGLEATAAPVPQAIQEIHQAALRMRQQ